MTNINVLGKGDEVLTLNEHFLAIKRKGGTVDIYNIFFSGDELCVDPLKAATIGYGSGSVEKASVDGEVKLVTF